VGVTVSDTVCVIVGVSVSVPVPVAVVVSVMVGDSVKVPVAVKVSVTVYVGVGVGGIYSYAPISTVPSCGLAVPSRSTAGDPVFVPRFLHFTDVPAR
jgi:hypothetical protein